MLTIREKEKKNLQSMNFQCNSMLKLNFRLSLIAILLIMIMITSAQLKEGDIYLVIVEIVRCFFFEREMSLAKYVKFIFLFDNDL